jgi:hypothetical protein
MVFRLLAKSNVTSDRNIGKVIRECSDMNSNGSKQPCPLLWDRNRQIPDVMWRNDSRRIISEYVYVQFLHVFSLRSSQSLAQKKLHNKSSWRSFFWLDAQQWAQKKIKWQVNTCNWLFLTTGMGQCDAISVPSYSSSQALAKIWTMLKHERSFWFPHTTQLRIPALYSPNLHGHIPPKHYIILFLLNDHDPPCPRARRYLIAGSKTSTWSQPTGPLVHI